MIKKKVFFSILLMILLSTAVYSLSCLNAQPCQLLGACKNNTYVTSTATINIWYPNGTIFVDTATMVNFSTGKFNYTFISPPVFGEYLASIECNIGGVTGVDEQAFNIMEDNNKMISAEFNLFNAVILVALMFIIHFILVIIGFRFKMMAFAFVGGVLGVIIPLVSIQLLMPLLTTLTIMLFSMYTIISLMFMYTIFVKGHGESD